MKRKTNKTLVSVPYQNTLDVPSDVAENVSKENLKNAIKKHRQAMSKLINK